MLIVANCLPFVTHSTAEDAGAMGVPTMSLTIWLSAGEGVKVPLVKAGS